MDKKLNDANFPHTDDGRVYHVGIRSGELANRIITVGDHVRARRISKEFDKVPKLFEYVSQRGFTTLTGRYRGVPVSIVAIGMGYPMMDFFVRETRAVVDGDLVIIRLGSCGTIVPELPIGGIVVCSRALSILTNYDYFHLSSEEKDSSSSTRPTSLVKPYLISKPIHCDKALHDDLALELEKSKEIEVMSNTLHAAADSFYSSQGRIDPNFSDDNQDLLETLKTTYPEVVSLEMETSHLFHLAAIASSSSSLNKIENLKTRNQGTVENQFVQSKGKIRAAAAHITFAGRVNGDFISKEQVEKLESYGGKACLETLIKQIIQPENHHPEEGSVWAN
ncbi:nucleoside phosphorylase domain-containing protein [Phakopsora pachyrhizi]|uniref:Nucleoside phosphorylase domain-containing protein n=1 Tax=Phakopsora pachyrhizi TaxID=170000 RepID=A0AAV0BDH7_PHAPC|nr:nucleoside phosphorylase domain-containing protein [Phakopsora pachyrhizi]CAH7685328.1 nucleoside phosphorylase domain-containing protein [Phakopsora pachyrhizi]